MLNHSFKAIAVDGQLLAQGRRWAAKEGEEFVSSFVQYSPLQNSGGSRNLCVPVTAAPALLDPEDVGFLLLHVFLSLFFYLLLCLCWWNSPLCCAHLALLRKRARTLKMEPKGDRNTNAVGTLIFPY